MARRGDGLKKKKSKKFFDSRAISRVATISAVHQGLVFLHVLHRRFYGIFKLNNQNSRNEGKANSSGTQGGNAKIQNFNLFPANY